MIGDILAAGFWVALGAVLCAGLRAQLASEQRSRHDARHLARQEEARRAMGRSAEPVDLEWEWSPPPRRLGRIDRANL